MNKTIKIELDIDDRKFTKQIVLTEDMKDTKQAEERVKDLIESVEWTIQLLLNGLGFLPDIDSNLLEIMSKAYPEFVNDTQLIKSENKPVGH